MSHCVFARHLLSKNAEGSFFLGGGGFMHALWSLCSQGQLLGEIFKQNHARGRAVAANIITGVMRSQLNLECDTGLKQHFYKLYFGPS